MNLYAFLEKYYLKAAKNILYFTQVAFGMDINSVNETNPFCQAITVAFRGFAERARDPFIDVSLI